MRVAIVGAGVAGLTAGLALQRDGHEVRIFEQASELRTGGFGLNLWANATDPLHRLGVTVPGEPYDHMTFRTGGRARLEMPLPTKGQPHMNGERGALMRAINQQLVDGTVRFGVHVSGAAELLDDGADLVVAADGVGSQLRPDRDRPQRISDAWSVWQTVIPDAGHLVEVGGAALVLTPARFYGIFRHPAGEVCWFVEDPSLPSDTTAAKVLDNACNEEDPLVRAVAELTPVGRLGQWLARDRRPTRGIVGDRAVAIGDAAHPMLPCIGQGACTSIEDGVALALALRRRTVGDGLDCYRRRRLPVARARVSSAHLACELRRPGRVATTIAGTPIGLPFAYLSGLGLRVINRRSRWMSRELAAPAGA